MAQLLLSVLLQIANVDLRDGVVQRGVGGSIIQVSGLEVDHLRLHIRHILVHLVL